MQMPLPNKVIAPIVTFVAALLVLISGTIVGIGGIALVPCLIVVIVLISKPRALLSVYWFFLLMLPAAEILFPSVILKAMEQGFGLLLLAITLAAGTISKKPVAGIAWIMRSIITLSIIIVISAVINKVPAKCVLFYVMIYMKHFWVFLFALKFLKKDDARFVFYAIMASFIIQLPFNIATYCGLNPLPHILYRGFVDWSMGTLGSASDVGYYMMAGIILLFSYIKYTTTVNSAILAMLTAVIFCIQFFFTYTMHAYPLLALGLVMQFILFTHSSMSKGVRLIFTMAVVSTILSALLFVGPYSDVSSQIVNKAKIAYRWEKTANGPKLEAYKAVFLHGSRYLPYPLLGGGPANYSSSIAQKLERPLAHLPHIGYVHETFFRADVSMGGSILSFPQTGFVALWGELGPLGFCIYWMTYIYAALRILIQIKRKDYRDRHRLILAESFIPFMTIAIILNLVTDIVPLSHINLLLWIWAATVWNPDSEEKPLDISETIVVSEAVEHPAHLGL